MIRFVDEIYGYKCDPAAARSAYRRAVATLASRSNRAKEIIWKVESNPHVIDVVVDASVGQESAFRGAVNGEKSSKLIWDPKLSFPILVDVAEVSETKKILGKDRVVTKTRARLSPLPAELVLIHELGHAAQYLGELPTYVTLFQAGNTAAIEADNLLKNEWPICDDYKLSRRSSYLHYNGSATASKWQIS